MYGQVEKLVPVEKIVYQEVPVPVDKVTSAGSSTACCMPSRDWFALCAEPSGQQRISRAVTGLRAGRLYGRRCLCKLKFSTSWTASRSEKCRRRES